MRYWFYIIVCLWLLLCNSTCKETTLYKFKKENISAADSLEILKAAEANAIYNIEEFFDIKYTKGLFNGIILLAKNNKILLQKTYGNKDTSRNSAPIVFSNSFQIASITKTFTSTAILQLHAKKLLNINDTIGKYIDSFPYYHITIKHLLAHRSGLPDYTYFLDRLFKGKRKKPISNDSVIHLFRKEKPKKYNQPDAEHEYNNTNYLLLASIIEKVSGMSYENYIQKNIFEPSSMKNSYVYNACKIKISKNSVSGFDNGKLVDSSFYNGCVGDKGIYSTAEDLLNYDNALRKNRLLPDSLQKLAYTNHNIDLDGLNKYGLGWRIRLTISANQLVYHTGWWKGFRSILARDFTNGYTIIILSNIRQGGFVYPEQLFNLLKKDDIVLVNSSYL